MTSLPAEALVEAPATPQTSQGQPQGQSERYSRLIELGIALSAERNHDRLLETILLGAKDLTHADGGTLYLRTEEDGLGFAILRNHSLGMAMGGTTGKPITFPPLRMYAEDGTPNHHNVATHVALSGRTVNIPDAYEARDGFDFSGTRKFDQGTGYRSMSFLTLPLKDRQDRVIGVLQLINATDPVSGNWVPFDPELEPLVEALASQAAVALQNRKLIDAQKALLDSFIKVLADAIDEKSPYTGGHCQRVPVITEMLARAAHDSDDERFREFHLNDDEFEELSIAAWLHDIGKVTTPEHVVDKSTKLETIFDRISLVRLRFALLKRDRLLLAQERALAGEPEEAEALANDLNALDDELAFLEKANIGGEFMKDEDVARVAAIAGRTWADQTGEEHPLLSEEEVRNLCIRKGTLTNEERNKINDHIVQTIRMLNELPFPDHLRRVPEYAGGHHEKMDGSGYPYGLRGEQLSLPARMMAIADIFEALTAADRPYKKAKTVSESLKIMGFMRNDNHIDPDLFDLFLTSGIWKEYAETYLKPEQIDEVDINRYRRAAS